MLLNYFSPLLHRGPTFLALGFENIVGLAPIGLHIAVTITVLFIRLLNLVDFAEYLLKVLEPFIFSLVMLMAI